MDRKEYGFQSLEDLFLILFLLYFSYVSMNEQRYFFILFFLFDNEDNNICLVRWFMKIKLNKVYKNFQYKVVVQYVLIFFVFFIG